MRTLIIDDERLARKELNTLLAKHTEIEILGECSNAEEAIKMIEELNPDLIFLDVQMPGMNGFEMLQQLENVPEVIFVTAFDEYALKAFEINALDYLLKPVEEDRLAETIQKIVKNRALEEKVESNGAVHEGRLGQEDQIFLKDGEKCWFVSMKDIPLLS